MTINDDDLKNLMFHYSFDKESKLYKDLQTLKKQEATADGVLLSMTFTVSLFFINTIAHK